MENELKHLLRGRAEEMRLPPEIPRPVLRRARRHRRITGALAGLAAIALVAVGFVGIRAALVQRTEVRTPIGPPTTQPTPSPSPTEATLGFPFPVCDVTSVQGAFRDSETLGTAYVATRRGDVGGCPQPGDAFTVVGIDLDGNGEVDASHGPIGCFGVNCRAFAAPDLDANGTSELAVMQQWSSVPDVKFYVVEDGEIVPAEVIPPGDPEGGFEPGEQPLLSLNGGDGFNSYALRCEDRPEGRVIVAVFGTQDPPESGVVKAHETILQLRTGGAIHVTAIRDFEEPFAPDGQSFVQKDRVCGLDP